MAKIRAFTIYIDDLTGEVEGVKATKRFSEEGALFRMDVLKDTLEALQAIYDYEKKNFFNEHNQVGIS